MKNKYNIGDKVTVFNVLYDRTQQVVINDIVIKDNSVVYEFYDPYGDSLKLHQNYFTHFYINAKSLYEFNTILLKLENRNNIIKDILK